MYLADTELNHWAIWTVVILFIVLMAETMTRISKLKVKIKTFATFKLPYLIHSTCSY